MDTVMDVDLRSTMDIQITALEWMPFENGYLKYLPDEDKDVYLEQCPDGTLMVSPERYRERVMAEFDYPLDEVYCGENKILLRLKEFYKHCWVLKLQDPYISLIITILTQNKTADSARKTFYRLQHRYKGIDVHKMAAADKKELEELIRTSGPYKADFIIRCSQEIIDRYGGSIEWMRDCADAGGKGSTDEPVRRRPEDRGLRAAVQPGPQRGAGRHAHLPRLGAHRAQHGQRRHRGGQAEGQGRP